MSTKIDEKIKEIKRLELEEMIDAIKKHGVNHGNKITLTFGNGSGFNYGLLPCVAACHGDNPEDVLVKDIVLYTDKNSSLALHCSTKLEEEDITIFPNDLYPGELAEIVDCII